MTFEEQFPSIVERLPKDLPGRHGKGLFITIKDIQECCLDKQRVREAINSVCSKTKTALIGKMIKEELGLDDGVRWG